MLIEYTGEAYRVYKITIGFLGNMSPRKKMQHSQQKNSSNVGISSQVFIFLANLQRMFHTWLVVLGARHFPKVAESASAPRP